MVSARTILGIVTDPIVLLALAGLFYTQYFRRTAVDHTPPSDLAHLVPTRQGLLPYRMHIPAGVYDFCDAVSKFALERTRNCAVNGGNDCTVRIVELHVGRIPLGTLCFLNASTTGALEVKSVLVGEGAPLAGEVVRDNFPSVSIETSSMSPAVYRHKDGAVFDVVLVNPLYMLSDHRLSLEIMTLAHTAANTLARKDTPVAYFPQYVYLQTQLFSATDESSHAMVEGASFHGVHQAHPHMLRTEPVGDTAAVAQVSMKGLSKQRIKRSTTVLLHSHRGGTVHGVYFWWDWMLGINERISNQPSSVVADAHAHWKPCVKMFPRSIDVPPMSIIVLKFTPGDLENLHLVNVLVRNRTEDEVASVATTIDTRWEYLMEKCALEAAPTWTFPLTYFWSKLVAGEAFGSRFQLRAQWISSPDLTNSTRALELFGSFRLHNAFEDSDGVHAVTMDALTDAVEIAPSTEDVISLNATNKVVTFSTVVSKTARLDAVVLSVQLGSCWVPEDAGLSYVGVPRLLLVKHAPEMVSVGTKLSFDLDVSRFAVTGNGVVATPPQP
eukprot:PhM_4_TR13503/c0_g1_i1/m.75347